MKFARIGAPGAEVPAALAADGSWRDLRGVLVDLTPQALVAGLPSSLDGLPTVAPGRFGPPLAGIGKIVCIGLNYRSHAQEIGSVAPSEPVVFLKAPDTVVGPDDDVLIPRTSAKTDWEVELGVVIGRTARYLDDEQDALAHVAGYTISNDVSERAFQMERGGQWDKGKNCETFNPLGPWFVTADEVPDPQHLGLRLSVNGEVRQQSSTANMIFGVAHLIWYLSQFMVLHPGDVINTGTPEGVALGSSVDVYLRGGDVVELEIDGLGRQRQRMVQA
ncbi:fumarylacetoacetate hydrolase family protein [Jatrophihabitans sp.]|uniref:fumarylacetoacetate hydrolase family protein n=1 Tax=Jatrophihabitans sp. TaxID=1932789 RepID=UPI0030C6D31B|nr:fumarylacetoacetate hydrolase [Jatrophihabitans sp.]